MTYIINQLVTGYSTGDQNAKALLDKYDFTIVPVVNVDGYDFTWTTNRSWRKTRPLNTGNPCIGTDPNRNWNSHWCEDGASTNPCSDSYCGPRPFSEVEVTNVVNYVTPQKSRLKAFIDFHAYSQLWMAPYGYTTALPADSSEQARLGTIAVNAIKSNSGLIYQSGRISVIIYPASGSSADYIYDFLGTVYSYGVELRDEGQYGFLLPADQIKPQGAEIWASLVAFGAQLK